MSEKIERKIKLQVMDPCGIPIGEAIEMSYYNMGYQTPPEEHPPLMIGGIPIEWEPMKQVRYLLTIGDHKYWMNRKGEIMNHLTQEL